MAFPAEDTEARLLGLIAGAEPRLRASLIQSVTAARAIGSSGEIERLILAGRLDEAVEEAARIGAVRLADDATSVFVLAGEDTSLFLSDVLEVAVGFDQVNSRAVSTMQRERLRLIRGFTAEQRQATREALADGIRRGVNPREQARAFKASIGLTGRQQVAVNNYRRLLEETPGEALTRGLRDRRFDRTVRRAIRDGVPLTKAQVDRMVGRYGDRFVRFRAETIARTEALRAVHQGSEEMYRQAFDEGRLDPNEVVRTWRTAQDERVRGSHAAMEGQQRLVSEPFVSGNGNTLQHPGDPNASGLETVQCRCALATRIGQAAGEVGTGVSGLTPQPGASGLPPVRPPPVPESVLPVTRPRVGQRVESLLGRGLSNKETAQAVLREFPDASTTPKSVASVKSRLKSEGFKFPAARIDQAQSTGAADAVRALERGLPDGVNVPTNWVVQGETVPSNMYGTFIPGKGVAFNDAAMRSITAQQARQVAAHELGHHMNKIGGVELSKGELVALRRTAKDMSQADRRRYAYYLVDEDELVAEIYSQALNPSTVTSQGLDAARFNSVFADDIARAQARLRGAKPLAPVSPRTAAVELPAATVEAEFPSARITQEIDDIWRSPAGRGAVEWEKEAVKRGITTEEITALADREAARLVNKAGVHVRVSPSSLNKIIKDGRFKTQHEVGRSGGVLAPGDRAELEDILFGPASAEKRPIYGYLSENSWGDVKSVTHYKKSGDVTGTWLDQYGTVRVELKKSVRRRATFTSDDSFNGLKGDLLQNPPGTSRLASFKPVPVDRPSGSAWKAFRLEQLEKAPTIDHMGGFYNEVQVHGGVTLDDISVIRVADQKLFDRLKKNKTLQRLGIRIKFDPLDF